MQFCIQAGPFSSALPLSLRIASRAKEVNACKGAQNNVWHIIGITQALVISPSSHTSLDCKISEDRDYIQDRTVLMSQAT